MNDLFVVFSCFQACYFILPKNLTYSFCREKKGKKEREDFKVFYQNWRIAKYVTVTKCTLKYSVYNPLFSNKFVMI